MGRFRQDTATGHLWVEEGEPRSGVVAEVATLLPIQRTLSFAVPDSAENKPVIGQRVHVPVGRKGRTVVGFVVGLDTRVWGSTLRPIESVVDDVSYLTPELVELGRQIAEHYACPLGRTLKALTPEAVRRGVGFRSMRYAALKGSSDECPDFGGRIGVRQQDVMGVLAAATEPMRVEELLEASGASTATFRSLVKKGWVEVTTRREPRAELKLDTDTVHRAEPGHTLNPDQQAALHDIHQRIEEDGFSVTLLYGVTGSGKTEVYIHAIRRVLSAGRQAILLVPEIVLTTQLVSRLAARFDDVATYHSGLTDVQRSMLWRGVASGRRKVVIGTRSAVFSPCPNLGLIVVDEEQETSYKNLQAPRFHVRDVAIMRARQLGIPVVLGAATPSIEVWHRSVSHRDYRRVTLPTRVRSLPLPRIYVVDMAEERAEGKPTAVLSRSMERMLGETLDAGQQAIILMNRRGFAPRLHCPACRSRIECPRCRVGLVVHTKTGYAMCHYCSTRIPTPTVCPNVGCGGKLLWLGSGTQRVEEVLRERFREVRLSRVDSDTMSRPAEYRRIVESFSRREVDVLVGTQMIAKGLDFPHVSFVGVVDADPPALAADFRAHERLFQLITQVAGRAGRADVPGRVLVQTTMPQLSGLRHALKHDYEAFATEELEVRRRLGLPPFGRLARVVLSHERDERARTEAETLAQRVRDEIAKTSGDSAVVWGPNPCALARLQGRYRHDLLLRAADTATLRRLLRQLDESGALRAGAVKVMVDVDPVSMT